MGDFRFGIKTLDNLIVGPQGEKYGAKDKPFVGCIVGPDGVGKSILALHAVSMYRAETLIESPTDATKPTVIYVSTDLNHDQANATFRGLKLDRPVERLSQLETSLPYDYQCPKEFRSEASALKDPIKLLKVVPELRSEGNGGGVHGEYGLEVFLEEGAASRSHDVLFVDLAEHTAGDDWDLVNRLLGKLTGTKAFTQCPHLLVIDAIEGLEAMGDESDGYGLRRSRRSRLAQLIRLAKKAKCHVILIIEETHTDERLPEVFVSDLVIRLRSREEDGYLRRTVEIEKARGLYHVRGQHDISIRPSARESEKHLRQTQAATSNARFDNPVLDFSYVLVTPSLDVRHRDSPVPDDGSPAPLNPRDEHVRFFDIPEIDELLSSTHTEVVQHERTLAVIGDSGTYKSDLGLEFLATGFFQGTACLLLTTTQLERKDVQETLENRLMNEARHRLPSGLEIDLEKQRLSHDFDSRFIIRHVPPRYLSSAGLFHIIRANLKKLKVLGEVRVVIDDWTILLECHPSMARDPRLLQSLVDELNGWKVLSLLIATEPGSPSTVRNAISPHDLANLDIKKVYTWPVPFFGSRLTAATVFPSRDRSPKIYELRRNADTHLLEADSRLQLYSNLEDGNARRIPLEVQLYSGNHHAEDSVGMRNYNARIQSLFDGLYEKSPGTDHVLQFQNIGDYDDFREYVRSLDNTQLDRTLLIEVDEFWHDRRITSRDSAAKSIGGIIKRMHMDFGFLLVDRDAWWAARHSKVWTNVIRQVSDPGAEKDKFSQELATDAWENLALPPGYELIEKPNKPYSRSNFCTVGEVFNALCEKGQQFDLDEQGMQQFPELVHFRPSWTTFFEACRVVAQFNGIQPFDIDLRTGETLSTTVLEIWFSILANCLDYSRACGMTSNKSKALEQIRSQLHQILTDNPTGGDSWTLRQWADKTAPCLVAALVLLRQVLPRLECIGNKLATRKADARCAAFRTWYSTACLSQSENARLMPVGLPGRFSARGDWYIKAAGGSRSEVLAEQAISRLVSPELQVERLKDGVGLPDPDFAGRAQLESALTYPEAHGIRQIPMTVGEIDRLWQANNSPKDLFNGKPHWIYRSSISRYAAEAAPFLNLLVSVFREWTFLAPIASNWNRVDEVDVFREWTFLSPTASNANRVEEVDVDPDLTEFDMSQWWDEFSSWAVIGEEGDAGTVTDPTEDEGGGGLIVDIEIEKLLETFHDLLRSFSNLDDAGIASKKR